MYILSTSASASTQILFLRQTHTTQDKIYRSWPKYSSIGPIRNARAPPPLDPGDDQSISISVPEHVDSKPLQSSTKAERKPKSTLRKPPTVTTPSSTTTSIHKVPFSPPSFSNFSVEKSLPTITASTPAPISFRILSSSSSAPPLLTTIVVTVEPSPSYDTSTTVSSTLSDTSPPTSTNKHHPSTYDGKRIGMSSGIAVSAVLGMIALGLLIHWFSARSRGVNVCDCFGGFYRGNKKNKRDMALPEPLSMYPIPGVGVAPRLDQVPSSYMPRRPMVSDRIIRSQPRASTPFRRGSLSTIVESER